MLDILTTIRQCYDEFGSVLEDADQQFQQNQPWQRWIEEFINLEVDFIASEIAHLGGLAMGTAHQHQDRCGKFTAASKSGDIFISPAGSLQILREHFEWLQREVVPILRRNLRAQEREDLALAYFDAYTGLKMQWSAQA